MRGWLVGAGKALVKEKDDAWHYFGAEKDL